MSEKSMLLLPTFDGQTRGVAAVDPTAIHMIKPSVSPGMTTLFLMGNYDTNYLGIEMEMPALLEKLKAAGVNFTDLAGGRKIERGARQDDGH
jgi:hypothetical protein